MKQILFLAIVLALFGTPVWTQKAASTDSKALIAKQAASSKYENFELLSEEFSFCLRASPVKYKFLHHRKSLIRVQALSPAASQKERRRSNK